VSDCGESGLKECGGFGIVVGFGIGAGGKQIAVVGRGEEQRRAVLAVDAVFFRRKGRLSTKERVFANQRQRRGLRGRARVGPRRAFKVRNQAGNFHHFFSEQFVN
jgi:hypothetical protein